MKSSVIFSLHAFLVAIELSACQSIYLHYNALYLRGEIVGPDPGSLAAELGTTTTVDDFLETRSPPTETADEAPGSEPTTVDLKAQPTLLEDSEQPTGDAVLPIDAPPADSATSLECKPETSKMTTTTPPAVTPSSKAGGYGMVEMSGPITLSLVWRRCAG